ncbi:Crp/Fnr family transcriptional regulator [Listeria grandensis]|uniref:Crp/Fnr family transcriptional regulator n=1 Tax=Listeria grandensis TaxID=1494963 RepID=UPI00162AB0B5|nr:Crp/Fnr family transcriptional regulator [Listeria grandensis]MBC1475076.1 Crp/Fnr family transcriptional regulator [Listeria grandensis]
MLVKEVSTCINQQFRDYLLNDPTYPMPYEICYIDAKKQIIEEDHSTDSIYIIVSGVAIEQHEERILQFLGNNASFGIDAMFNAGTTATSVMALTKMVLYKFSIHDIRSKIAARPVGATLLGNMLSHHVLTLTEQLTDTSSNYDKTLKILLTLASFYGEEKNSAIYVTKYFTKKMIANYLQINYSTVASIFRGLIAEGILHDEPHGIILYPATI